MAIRVYTLPIEDIDRLATACTTLVFSFEAWLTQYGVSFVSLVNANDGTLLLTFDGDIPDNEARAAGFIT